MTTYTRSQRIAIGIIVSAAAVAVIALIVRDWAVFWPAFALYASNQVTAVCRSIAASNSGENDKRLAELLRSTLKKYHAIHNIPGAPATAPVVVTADRVVAGPVSLPQTTDKDKTMGNILTNNIPWFLKQVFGTSVGKTVESAAKADAIQYLVSQGPSAIAGLEAQLVAKAPQYIADATEHLPGWLAPEVTAIADGLAPSIIHDVAQWASATIVSELEPSPTPSGVTDLLNATGVQGEPVA